MKLVGTRDPHDTATFLEAAAGATPAHGGLFVPIGDLSAQSKAGAKPGRGELTVPARSFAAQSNAWPRFDDVDVLLAMPWQRRCVEILHRLLGDELDHAAIEAIVKEALDFGAPVVPLSDGTFALELFHGPTLAFKDFGARFLASVLERVPARGPRTILTATSGDTGAAVAHAFWKRPGVDVVVLYPRGRVSALQERQIACLGGNVTTFAVEGSFDDCQAMVKACFADRKLSEELGLTSANSINIARLVAQVLYYFEGVARVREHLESAGHEREHFEGVARTRERNALVVAVPSGNFGNLCAGLMAWKLGLDVRAFVAATNANDTVPEYLETGAYRPRESVSTLSNAMDVGAPSNWERIEALFDEDLAAMRGMLRSGRASDADTVDEQRRLKEIGYAACPHTAVGHRVLRQGLKPGEIGLFLATAHPAKFGNAVGKLPPALEKLRDQPILSETIPPAVDQLVRRMRSRG